MRSPQQRTAVATLVALTLVGSVAAGASDSRAISRADRICRKAASRLDDGRLEDAESAYRRALEAYPGSWAAHEGLGRVAMKRGEYAEALAHLARAWASFAEEQGRLTDAQVEAAVELDRVRQTYDDYALRGPNIGCGHQAPNEFEHQVELSTELAPPPGLFFRMGVCLLHLARPADAREAFLAEVQATPGSAASHVNLAVCELQLGRPEEALAELDRAVSLGADEPAGLRSDIMAARND
jgi:tetratricopeptide (TPR) repeat protein